MDGTILGKKYDIINGEGGGGRLTPATADTLGGIKVGEGLEVTEDGTASVNFPPAPEPYVLPTASAETLGGVKVGSGLSMNAETGVLSNANMPLNYSTNKQPTGQKWIDGKDIYWCTWDFGSNINISSDNYYTDFNIDSSSIDKVIFGSIMNSDGTLYNNACFDPTRENHTLLGIKPIADVKIRYLTLYYTETSV